MIKKINKLVGIKKSDKKKDYLQKRSLTNKRRNF